MLTILPAEENRHQPSDREVPTLQTHLSSRPLSHLTVVAIGGIRQWDFQRGRSQVLHYRICVERRRQVAGPVVCSGVSEYAE